jgi:hypothetical protein
MLLRVDVFTAMIMKNVVFWDVASCGSYQNLRFEELVASICRVEGRVHKVRRPALDGSNPYHGGNTHNTSIRKFRLYRISFKLEI